MTASLRSGCCSTWSKATSEQGTTATCASTTTAGSSFTCRVWRETQTSTCLIRRCGPASTPTSCSRSPVARTWWSFHVTLSDLWASAFTATPRTKRASLKCEFFTTRQFPRTRLTRARTTQKMEVRKRNPLRQQTKTSRRKNPSCGQFSSDFWKLSLRFCSEKVLRVAAVTGRGQPTFLSHLTFREILGLTKSQCESAFFFFGRNYFSCNDALE